MAISFKEETVDRNLIMTDKIKIHENKIEIFKYNVTNNDLERFEIPWGNIYSIKSYYYNEYQVIKIVTSSNSQINVFLK